MPVGPTVTISPIFSGSNQLNQARATAGFTIQGTATGIEIGQIVSIKFVNSANATVGTLSTLILLGNTWSVTVPPLLALGLADGPYSVQASSVSLAGLSANASTPLMVDETAPTVSTLTASPANASLGVGQIVTLTLGMSEAVTVSTTGGTPSLALSNGATATYISGSGTTQLVYRYTVAAGQNSADLAVIGSSLNGGTIADSFGNAANMLGAIANPAGILVIDSTPPVVSAVTSTQSIVGVGLGQAVTLTLTMSEIVNVSTIGGTPTLALNNGGMAAYISGSGTNQLVFRYTVGAGQDVADLAVTGLSLNGGTIADPAGNAANLAGAAANPAGILRIDATLPVITINPPTFAVNALTLATGFSINGTTTAEDGQVATIQLVDSSNVVVDSYNVVALGGFWAAPVPILQALALSDGSYTIRAGISDLAGNPAVQASQALSVDSTAPSVALVSAVPASAYLAAGQMVTLTLTMTEPVTVSTLGGTPILLLNNGATARYVGGSGTNLLVFTYTVAAGQDTPDLTVTGTSLNGGVIADLAGNVANLAGAVANPAGTLVIDTMPPTVVVVTASPSTADVGLGQSVVLTVNMNKIVTVSTLGGVPTLTLNNGGTATYLSGSGTTQLQFGYVVATGQDTADLTVTGSSLNGGVIAGLAGNAANLSGAVSNPAGTLQIDATPPLIAITPQSGVTNATVLSGGVTISGTTNAENGQIVAVKIVNNVGIVVDAYTTAVSGGFWSVRVTHGQGLVLADGTYTVQASTTDQAGNPSAVAIGSLAVDATAPTVLLVSAVPGVAELGVGQVVTLGLTMSEATNVSTTGGTPTLTLNDGGVATYVSGSGSNQLVFRYTVLAGQNTADLTVTGVALNGGTISDAAGNAANLAGATTNPAGVLVIDTTPPAISSITAAPSNADVGIGQLVTLTVNTSQPVTVDTSIGTPILTLNNGGTATYVSGSGSTQLVFDYTVGVGQDTPDLSVTGMALNGGLIADPAGNLISVAGAVGNPAGTLQIDATPPTIAITPMIAPINETMLNAGFTITGTTTAEDGQIATIKLVDSHGAVVDQYTVSASNGAWSARVTHGQGLALADGAYTITAAISDLAGNVASPVIGALTIDTVAPIVAIGAVAHNNTLNASGAAAGFTISGTTTGLADGQSTIVTIRNAAQNLVDNIAATVTGGVWSAAIPAAVAQGLSDGVYAVQASATDSAGNVSIPVSQTLTVDTVPPTITIAALGPINAATLDSGFAISGATTAENGQVAIVQLVDGNGSVVDHYTAVAVSGSWSVFVSHSQAEALASGVYTIQAGISDVAGNPATVAARSVTTDATIPSVVLLSASPATADLGIGQVVTLTMAMTEAVTVDTTNGAPTLTLSDGGSATYVSGSGTNQLVFQYTVLAGQNSGGLGVAAVALNGSVIADASGNAANLAGAVGNLPGLLLIDTTPPIVSSVTTFPSNGDIGIGQAVTLTVNMSQAVTVNGTPTLQLNNGGVATYVSGSGTAQLLFDYTVLAGQDTADLTVTGLTLNGGGIADLAGNAATLTAAITNPAGTLKIDATPPVIAITPMGAPINATMLNAGFTISGTTTAEDGQITTVKLIDGNGVVVDRYTVSVSGGAWSARVTHGQGLALADGNYTISAAIADVAGNAATPVTGSLTIDATVPVITIGSVATNNMLNATSVAAGFTVSGGTTGLADGQSTVVTIFDASQNVVDSVTATIAGGAWSVTIAASVAQALADGVYTVQASATDPAGNVAIPVTQNLTIDTVPPVIGITARAPVNASTQSNGFSIVGTTNAENAQVATVQLVDGNGTVVDSYATSAIAGVWSVWVTRTQALLLADGTYTIRASIADAAGNVSTVASSALSIDTSIPSVLSVAASPGTAQLSVGQVVTLTLTMSEAVTVSTIGGTPTLTLNNGSIATYVSGSGSNQLSFSYTVGAGQDIADLEVTGASSNGGVIGDLAGNIANLAGAVADPAGILVIDTIAPTILSVTAPQSAAGIGLGQVVTLTLNMSQAAVVSTLHGTPTLALSNGGIATYVSGSGSTQLVFQYTVSSGQDSTNLSVTSAALNGAIITDPAGNIADLSNVASALSGSLRIDATPPVIAITPLSTAIDKAVQNVGFTIGGGYRCGKWADRDDPDRRWEWGRRRFLYRDGQWWRMVHPSHARSGSLAERWQLYDPSQRDGPGG